MAHVLSMLVRSIEHTAYDGTSQFQEKSAENGEISQYEVAKWLERVVGHSTS